MKVLGIDPAMNNTGLVVAELDIQAASFHVLDMYLVETKGGPKPKTVRQNSIDLEKARAIAEAIEEKLDGVDMVFTEMPIGSQSARAMASYGICVGVLAAIKQPLIQITPIELKQKTVGNKTATKDEMIEWAVAAHPYAPWLRQGQRITKKNEHLADALGAIHAGLQTNEYKAAAAILRFMK